MNKRTTRSKNKNSNEPPQETQAEHERQTVHKKSNLNNKHKEGKRTGAGGREVKRRCGKIEKVHKRGTRKDKETERNGEAKNDIQKDNRQTDKTKRNQHKNRRRTHEQLPRERKNYTRQSES